MVTRKRACQLSGKQALLATVG
eukprot:COSAG01_NODE_37695_length_500_cov_0.710723_1_plen_21_part_01